MNSNIEKIIKTYCENNKVNGLSVSMHVKKKPYFTFNYGFQERNKTSKVNQHTRFTIGSVSKTFTALAILQLVEKGYFTLESYVYELLPRFKMKDPRYKLITVKMLLNHSSGLSSTCFRKKYTNVACFDFNDVMYEYYQDSYLKSEPGKYSVYCNDGFTFAELLIREASGLSFAEYIAKHILTPLQMNDTDFPIHQLQEGTYCHSINPYGYQERQEYVNGIGTGGIYSTANDLCALLDGLLTSETLGVSASLMKEMISYQAINPYSIESTDSWFGLGFDHVELPVFKSMGFKAITKGGATFGYLSNILWIPELELSLSVVSSANQGDCGRLLQSIALEYLEEQGIHPKKNQLEQLHSIVSIDEAMGLYVSAHVLYKLEQMDGLPLLFKLEKGNFNKVDLKFEKMEEGYQCISDEKIFNIQRPLIRFIKENQQILLVVDYQEPVSSLITQRTMIAWKINKLANPITLDHFNGVYLKTNEFINQRTMDHSPVLISSKQIKGYAGYVFVPYPLKIIDSTTAISFQELFGNLSREMDTLHYEDGIWYLGQYMYQSVEQLEILRSNTYYVNHEHIHWLKLEQNIQSIDTNGCLRYCIIDEHGTILHDSNLIAKFNYPNEGAYFGFLGEEGSSITITVED